ncbi:alanine dehydrogenase [Actinobaculum suis]|uniref:Alanine dehydrogenase n=1 Tax=Actinobaculum suis TaxID=1657 RepID=A0A0K9EUZ5_9ACTO|nr:alanine dehydrogenase [Actinobaculum suis]KMY23968.1 alanine dehydrogenase [Actinobaculum suis]VDG76041.1 alanine dehydrogenase [Actinobaculum suis]
MRIGVPTELKNNEYRVALTPAGARELTEAGHEVVVQSDAGRVSGFSDEAYAAAGAKIGTAGQAWAADLVLKVKEPEPEEYHYLRPDLVLFTYLHLASNTRLVRALLDAGTISVAYETVREGNKLPLLAPMSRVAGNLSPIIGSYHLMEAQGGSGMLIGGVAGTRPARVAVVGGGVAGESAAVMAAGMGGDVTVLDISVERLAALRSTYGSTFKTLASNAQNIEETVANADLVIGSVLIPGASAPKLVTSAMVRKMREGSVLVDIAIDQGGCFEGSHPTTHQHPTFDVDGKIFYCVANMPGAVPQTATEALTNTTLPYAMQIANHGWREALTADPGFRPGLNTAAGKITNRAVFDSVAGTMGLQEADFTNELPEEQ